MVLTEIATGLSVVNGAVTAFKAGRETIKAIGGKLDRENRLKIEAMIDDMTDRLREAQEAVLALTDRCRELEQENNRLVQFKIDAQNYELRQIAPNSFAYAVKPDVEHLQRDAHLCANCFDQSQKSILQLEKQGPFGMDTLKCPRCETRVMFDSGRSGAAGVTIATVKRSSRFDGDW
ncbi:hypothetical protein D3874_03230 [Oleomonas cavernae]|uniref:Uncharacterized protein n=1 Tax=Oleomonas cavernae TaxID=2320859 RepID=A0A418WUD2_9PROT|nr:hypothetical protein [Oleomonas cavernae]RJF94841.1 hypothetical protein D3874_03230 [Oleomonas cavernae]